MLQNAKEIIRNKFALIELEKERETLRQREREG